MNGRRPLSAWVRELGGDPVFPALLGLAPLQQERGRRLPVRCPLPRAPVASRPQGRRVEVRSRLPARVCLRRPAQGFWSGFQVSSRLADWPA